jgi:transcriptional regulator with XRE-family HTH domain
MALFFDQAWFNARLAALGLGPAHVAAALGLTPDQVAEIWKDQRELKAREVAVLAALLGAPAAEIANRAGVSTPVPNAEPTLADLAARIEKLEAEVAALKSRQG